MQAGGTAETLRRLQEPDVRRRLRYELEQVGTDGSHGVPVDWSSVVISGTQYPSNAHTVGSSIAELAAQGGDQPTAVFFDLLMNDRLGATALFHVGNLENVERLMRHPRHTAGSDGILVGDRPHPRAWGTFPRYLGYYVRERGVLGLEEAVTHLTTTAARRLGLRDRGVVATGYAADLVCFDPDLVTDTSTYKAPRRRSAGIEYVMINGQLALDAGELVAQSPGVAIRRTRAGHKYRQASKTP